MAVDVSSIYLELLKKTLSRYDLGDNYLPVAGGSSTVRILARLSSLVLQPLGLELCRVIPSDSSAIAEGRVWPANAETMIGLRRLDNLEACINTVIKDLIPGDFLEAGIWRGGAGIFMRAALNILGDQERIVWLADSFQGLPPPRPDVAADQGSKLHKDKIVAVDLDTVKANFAKYGLLDDNLRFLEGWFCDTLPMAPISELAILRADGDMYSSTMDILEPLYKKVASGGFIIIDDFGAVPACRRAVEDFRESNTIREPLIAIDWSGVFWRKD